jgi:hypothetical protein
MTFPADREKHGHAADLIRNKQMLEQGKPDLVVAPGGRESLELYLNSIFLGHVAWGLGQPQK